jgi:hypothetical protein
MASFDGQRESSSKTTPPLGQQIPPAAQRTPLHTRLTEIDAEMAYLQAQLERLTVECKPAAAALDSIVYLQVRLERLTVERKSIAAALDSIIYPILTIPPEITAEIFIHYVALDEWVELHKSASGPLLLVSICRSWHSIALNLRRLWA